MVVGEAEEEGKLSITSIDTNTLATRYITWRPILTILRREDGLEIDNLEKM